MPDGILSVLEDGDLLEVEPGWAPNLVLDSAHLGGCRNRRGTNAGGACGCRGRVGISTGRGENPDAGRGENPSRRRASLRKDGARAARRSGTRTVTGTAASMKWRPHPGGRSPGGLTMLAWSSGPARMGSPPRDQSHHETRTEAAAVHSDADAAAAAFGPLRRHRVRPSSAAGELPARQTPVLRRHPPARRTCSPATVPRPWCPCRVRGATGALGEVALHAWPLPGVIRGAGRQGGGTARQSRCWQTRRPGPARGGPVSRRAPLAAVLSAGETRWPPFRRQCRLSGSTGSSAMPPVSGSVARRHQGRARPTLLARVPRGCRRADGPVELECGIEPAGHVDMRLGDAVRHVLAVGERDCSRSGAAGGTREAPVAGAGRLCIGRATRPEGVIHA